MFSGSPPRMRGKGAGFPALPQCQGITPAWAGKSSSARIASGVKLGSPPHRRGKGAATVQIPRERRITPAWAGKSMTAPGRSSRTGDHPRVGGEKSWWGDEVTPKQGSPPRRRGKVVGKEILPRRVGITPAWAGKRPGGIPSSMAVKDHPRVGGEKYSMESKL